MTTKQQVAIPSLGLKHAPFLPKCNPKRDANDYLKEAIKIINFVEPTNELYQPFPFKCRLLKSWKRSIDWNNPATKCLSSASYYNSIRYSNKWVFVLIILFMLINCNEASCPSSSWVKSIDCPGSKLSACTTQRCSYEPIYNNYVDTDCKNKNSDGDYSYNGWACCTKSGWYLADKSFYRNNDYASKYVICVVSLLYSFYLIILSTP